MESAVSVVVDGKQSYINEGADNDTPLIQNTVHDEPSACDLCRFFPSAPYTSALLSITGFGLSAAFAIPCGGLGYSVLCNAAFVLQPASMALGVYGAAGLVDNLYQSITEGHLEADSAEGRPSPSWLNKFNAYSYTRKIACVTTGISTAGLVAASVSSGICSIAAEAKWCNAAFILQPLSLAIGLGGFVPLIGEMQTKVKTL